jgi:hypothetical protein
MEHWPHCVHSNRFHYLRAGCYGEIVQLISQVCIEISPVQISVLRFHKVCTFDVAGVVCKEHHGPEPFLGT